MSHADELARLRDAVVEAATRFVLDAPDVSTLDVTNAVDEYLAARAATCGGCGGCGVVRVVTEHAPGSEYAVTIDYPPCSDCGGTGRKRQDRFRDDSATTPEGHER